MTRIAFLIFACLWVPLTAVRAQAQDVHIWPPLTQTAKPWTRWWWPGSAVSESNLTRQLESFAAAGLGGVEITPIYGVRGAEEHDIAFLSSEWMRVLEHASGEAKRLDLGFDMATGTGWPFGGPRVVAADAIQKMVLNGGRLIGEPTG